VFERTRGRVCFSLSLLLFSNPSASSHTPLPSQYIFYYWSLLSSSSTSSSLKKASDLLTEVLISSNKSQSPASVYWLETSSLLTYLSLVRKLFQEILVEEIASGGPEGPESAPQKALELMREFFQTTEGILIRKKHLFHPKLRESCVELLLEMHRGVTRSPSTHQNSERHRSSAAVAAGESTVLEWCAGQSWGTLSTKRNRASKGTSRLSSGGTPSSSDSSSPRITLPESEFAAAAPALSSERSPRESAASVSGQSRKRGPSGSAQLLPEDDRPAPRYANKKQRAMVKTKQLLLLSPRGEHEARASPSSSPNCSTLESPPSSPRAPPHTPRPHLPLLPPHYPSPNTRQLLQMIPHSVERRKFPQQNGAPLAPLPRTVPGISIHSSCIPSSPTATALAVSPASTAPVVRDAATQRTAVSSPNPVCPQLVPSAPSFIAIPSSQASLPPRSKDKKRKAILKLREIFYREGWPLG
jgi:hypothetical protein